jgi:endonuclease/exonuclease/phosphatase family metal-dependent hydrolase
VLEPIAFEELGPGWVLGARYRSDGPDLTLINVHVQFSDIRFSTDTLHQVIDIVEPRLSDGDVIFAGDLNVDARWDDVHGTTRHRQVLQRLTETGLFHANSLLPPGTYTNQKHPYQIDHFFVSGSLRESIEDVRVIVGSRVSALSDHYPLVLDLAM